MRLYIKLEEILDSRNIPKMKFADKIGIRRNVISELCSNQRTSFNREHVAKIAKELNITDMNELFEIRE
ncbi:MULTISPECIES: helix-turn-helix domain-containing protein [Bacillus]|uniref:helix-turn-helix domain-containing protein n=1 Tax=Bacillus TaxID=1386 RepID=UPI000471A70F|nr:MULTISPECIES: helix-turn-helix transcriptional regulator [Bacillus]AKD29035.1 hypothetical protein AW02_008830 [Bacillus velezensis NJN-6]APH50385.1 transcriptional regulator [Bacillus amyloliquefaciens]APH50469.1 transcriptional regulator [Bacillus amyloliquefaciens]ASB64837.1 hypothetical protein S101413_01390 [Bacillus velezensis]AUS14885.1 XRE family transcriptional regulator [Bacillus velezensis]